MTNGCNDHLYEAVPGCVLCYAHLQGGNDALRMELKKANLQIHDWEEAAKELLKAPHNSFADAAARERVKALLRGISEKKEGA
jgi:phage shock protein A